MRSILLGVGGQRDAVDRRSAAADWDRASARSGRDAGCRGLNGQFGMEAQGALVDVVRRTLEIDAADIGEIARGQRAGDRLGAVPPFQRASPCARRRPARAIAERPGRPSCRRCARLGRIPSPRPAPASRHGHRRRRSRSNSSGPGRCACSASFRRGTGTGSCGWRFRAHRAVDQVGEIDLGLDIRPSSGGGGESGGVSAGAVRAGASG